MDLNGPYDVDIPYIHHSFPKSTKSLQVFFGWSNPWNKHSKPPFRMDVPNEIPLIFREITILLG